jgi:hypothetical protein
MEKIEYLVLTSQETPQGPIWSGSNGLQIGLNLPLGLNQLGSQGWEMIGAVDVTRSSRQEIFLKRRKA